MRKFLIFLSSFLIIFGVSTGFAGVYIEDFEDGNLNPEWYAYKTYEISSGRLHMTEGKDYFGIKESEVGLWLTDELIYKFEADVSVPPGYGQTVGICLQWGGLDTGVWDGYQVFLKFRSYDQTIMATIGRLLPSGGGILLGQEVLEQGNFNTWYNLSITLHNNYITFGINGIETDLFHDLFDYNPALINTNLAYVHGHDGIPDVNYYTDNLVAYSSKAQPNLYGLFVGQDSTKNLRGDLIAEEIHRNFSNLRNVKYNKLITDEFFLPITQQRIAWAIDTIKNQIKPGDIFIMYIAGHGVESTIHRDETTLTEGDEYILLGDFLAGQFMLEDDELTSMLDGMEDVEKWILVDSCMSGGFWGNGNVNDIGDLEKLNNISLIAASEEDRPMYYDERNTGLPLFGQALRDALEKGADGFVQADGAGENNPRNGVLTFQELSSYLRDVNKYYARDPDTGQIINVMEGIVVAEGAFGDLVELTPDMLSPVSKKSDDFIGIMFTDLPDTPVANANGPYSGPVGFPITFDATGSYSPNGDIVLFEWDWNNEGTYDEATTSHTITHTWNEAFSGTVTLRVTDSEGLTEIDSASVEVFGVAICSNLGDDPKPSLLDQDIFKFYGTEGENITITLAPDTSGTYTGERATLILKDRIQGVRLFKKDRGALPNTITTTLPATGKYYIIVAEQPRFMRGKRFKGDYCLILNSSQDAWQTLESTPWVE